MGHPTRLPRAPVLMICLMLLGGCDPAAPDPLDPGYDAPALRSLILSGSTVDTDTIFVGPERLPEDILTIRLAASVDLVTASGRPDISASVRDGAGARISSSASFTDDGAYPDTVAGDARYTGLVSFTVERSQTGVYTIAVSALDQSQLPSNALVAAVQLFRSNLPPVISLVEADTLVSLSGGNTTLQLRTAVADPNGLADVRRVWFDSFRPDGSPSSSNPFLMFDDGNTIGVSGDQTAGDGIYSLKIAFAGAALGTYRFSFKASDRSLDTSNVIDHFISVVP